MTRPFLISLPVQTRAPGQFVVGGGGFMDATRPASFSVLGPQLTIGLVSANSASMLVVVGET